ncbi:MAG: hypothetical protein IKT00_12875 [Prevotella sp.]|nr:hypothetical protein [Prevotella sp.]
MKVIKIIFIALLVVLSIIYGVAFFDTWLFKLVLFCILIYFFVRVLCKWGNDTDSNDDYNLGGW